MEKEARTLLIPAELKYSKEHEWIKTEGNIAVIGITEHAQDALGDIVFVDLPTVGDKVSADGIFGVVESAKAASDLYVPVSGTVIEINEELLDTPEIINKKPYGAWMIKVEMSEPGELDKLLDAQAYQEFCANEA